MNAIKIENLTKRYKDLTAVDNLSLDIAEGELFSLLGVNGAGKTTTIKMLSCLSFPTSGDALVLGESITKNPTAVKALIGVSPQETAVASGLTVRENLEFICGIYTFPKEKTTQSTKNTIAALKLCSFGTVFFRFFLKAIPKIKLGAKNKTYVMNTATNQTI